MKPERRLPVTPLTLEVVRELAHAESVQDEWARFTASLPGITPFHLSAWQLTWWRHFGDGRLHIMLFRSLDTLVAMIPCYLTEQDGRPTLKLLGSGMASYLEPPIAAAQRASVVSLLKSHLLANKTWQMCDWRNVAPASPLAGLQLGDGFDLKIVPDSEGSQVPIQGTFQQYWEARSFSLRRNFLKYLDNSSAFPDRPRLEVVNQADPEFVNAIIRLQGERADAFAHAKEGAAAFLVDLAKVCDKADLLRMFALRYDRKLVAAALAFVHRNTVYAFAGGHDPAFESLGFGRLLLFEGLRYAFQQGYRAWNFLRGNEPYKLLWGAQITPTARITIERKPNASEEGAAPKLQ
jgi:CelD/BcsL family acetyltransferase involved in cellulose biosynthesis